MPRKRKEVREPLTRLIEARKASGHSQESISEYLGCDRGTYARYENGVCPIPSDKLYMLSKALNVSADYLLSLDDHLNKGNKELAELSGLSEKAIETLRKLNEQDNMILTMLIYNATNGLPYQSVLHKGCISVLDTMLSDLDTFTAFAVTFLKYSDPLKYNFPVVKNNKGEWVPLQKGSFGLASGCDNTNDIVQIDFDEHITKAVYKNALDNILNLFVDMFRKRAGVPSVK
jgi:transcriptional regulator with XRE-family HTH domain